MSTINATTVTTTMLLDKYKELNQKPINSTKLHFAGVEGFDIYNITKPFENEDKQVIAGRVEKRDEEWSTVIFFEQVSAAEYHKVSDYPTFKLQDPFVAFIHGELVLGGVEVFPHPDYPVESGNLWYRTVFYKGKTIQTLEKFAEGPLGMKDIRFVELSDKKIGVFTRPQGEIGGRGQIGFFVMEDWSQFTEENILNAHLLKELFITEEWGGVNEAHLLANGEIGVLGHIASFDSEGNRHYYPFVFTFNHETMDYHSVGLLFERADIQPGETKRPDLVDVIFPGGIVLKEAVAEVYVGVSDAEAQYVVIPNPFI